jgi:hypothetical protein
LASLTKTFHEARFQSCSRCGQKKAFYYCFRHISITERSLSARRISELV